MGNWVSGSDLKLGLRWLRKQPVMAVTAVVALAVGIFLATTGFTVLEATLFGKLPLAGGERFVRLRAFAEPGGRVSLDLDRYHLLRERATSFEHLGAIGADALNLIDAGGAVEPVRAALVTPRSLRFVPETPLLGRTLVAADGEPGAPPVVLLRESLWRRRFGADPAVLGRGLDLAGIERTVVGVMPDRFEFPASGEVWVPLDEQSLGGTAGAPRPGVEVFGILRPGVSLQRAAAEVSALSDRVVAGQTTSAPEVRVSVVPYTEPPEGFELMMWVLMTVLVAVLLVVAANVANLVLARTAARAPELAVRTALGASRARLVGQLFVEVTLLGVLAAAVGVGASRAALGWLDAQLGPEMPFWIHFTPGAGTAAFVVAITLAACVVGGMLPALRATRRDPAEALKAGGRSGGFGFGRFGTAMVVVEMALSVAMISASLVMARGFLNSTRTDLDLPRGEVLTARIAVPPRLMEPAAATAEEAAALQSAVLRAAAAVPGVSASGAASQLPRIDPPVVRAELAVEAGEAPLESVLAPMAAASPGYFDALGATAVAGRVFREADFGPGAPPVAIVNQPFVDRFLGGRNPLGRRLRVAESGPAGATRGAGEAPPWREIIGVVPDLGLSVADPRMAAGFYVPLDRAEPFYYLALRSGGDPKALVAPLRRALAAVDPEIDVHRLETLERVGWEDREFMSGFGSALVACGGMALLLSLAGIYALMSFTVTRRTREIGVRVALGAGRRQVLATVLGRAALHTLAGALLGGLLAQVFLRAKAMLVTRLPAGEPWVVPAVLGLLALAGVVASWVPARRALAVEPTAALRAE